MKYTAKILSAILSAALCASGASAPLTAYNAKDTTTVAPAYTAKTAEMVDAETLAPQSAANAESSETVITDELEVKATTTEAESTTTTTAISEACEPSEASAPLQNDAVLIEAPEAPCMTTMTENAYEELPTETTTTEAVTGIGAIAPEVEQPINSTEWYAKPGDQKVYTDQQVVFTFTDFVKVTEATVWDGNTYWTELSGFTPAIGEWKIRFTEAKAIGDGSNLPFTIEHGVCALGLPIAAEYGPTTVNDWTFKAEETEMVSYSPATGVTYVYGEGWDAMVLDYTRYSEWNYSASDSEVYADNFAGKENYSLVAYANDSWVIATANAPEIVREGEKGKELTLSEVAEKLANATPLVGFNDPKWGAISWDEFGREDWTEGPGATHYLGGTIDGDRFEIAIDSTENVLGFCPEFSWQAAIVPRDFVAYEDVSSLIWGDYTIYCDDPTGNTVRIYQSSTDSACEFELNAPARMDTAVMLITITDGKHAAAVTCRPELVAFIYALAQ